MDALSTEASEVVSFSIHPVQCDATYLFLKTKLIHANMTPCPGWWDNIAVPVAA